MWGSSAEAYSTKLVKKPSMKWHLVKDVEYGTHIEKRYWGPDKVFENAAFGIFDCDSVGFPDRKQLMVVKEQVNLAGTSVCTYCKRRRLKELGINGKIMG